jgi:hypothetical protein
VERVLGETESEGLRFFCVDTGGGAVFSLGMGVCCCYGTCVNV